MDIQYALMIETRTSTASVEAIGMYTGVMCLITGRPGYGYYIAGTRKVSLPVVDEDEISLDLAKIGPEDLPLKFDIEGSDGIFRVGFQGVSNPVYDDTGLTLDVGALGPGFGLVIDGTTKVKNPDVVPEGLSFDLAEIGPQDVPLQFEMRRDATFDIIGSAPIDPPVNPNTGNPQLRWKEGLISKQYLGIISEAIDPTLGGGYSTMSMSQLSLVNQIPGLGKSLFQYLKDSGIDLFRCRIRSFVVLDGKFIQRAENQIENILDGESLMGLIVADSSKEIHKPVLKTEVSKRRFPDAPEDSLGKFLPLAIGRIPEAKGLRVTGEQPETLLGTNAGVPLYITRMKAGDGAFTFSPLVNPDTFHIILQTPGNPFVTNDPALAGRFLEVVFAGVDGPKILSPMILGNDASAGGFTRVKISDFFRNESEEVVFPKSTPTGFDSEHLEDWYFRVVAISEFQAFSDSEVANFHGPLLGWSDELSEFFAADQIERQAYPSADYSEVDGVAGSLLYPRGEKQNVPTQRNWIRPLFIRRHVRSTDQWFSNPSNSSFTKTSDQFGEINKPLPLLMDRSGATGYSRTWSVTKSGSLQSQVMYNIPLNQPERNDIPPLVAVEVLVNPTEGFLLDSEERVRVGLDMSLLLSARTSGPFETRYEVGVSVALVDVVSGAALKVGPYRRMAGGDLDAPVPAAPTGTVYNIRNMSGDYYLPRLEPSAWSLTDIERYPWGNEDEIARILSNPGMAPSMRFAVRVHIRWDSFFNTGPAITAPFGFTINEVALFRARDNYEGDVYQAVTGVKFGSTWEGRKDPNTPVTSVPDAIEYLIRERDGSSLVDTHTFNLAAGRRPFTTWFVGHQITEQANTKDLIDDLAKHGFLTIAPGRSSKRRLVPLEGLDTHVITFDESNIIHGSMAEAKIVGLDRVYTSLELRYDKNPASGEYRGHLFIRKTNEPVFPDENEVLPGTNIPLWSEYAGGFKDYPVAAAVWAYFHQAYLTVGAERVLNRNLDWFRQNPEDEDPPVYLALLLGRWYSQPRKQYAFRIAVTEEHLGLLLGDKCWIGDRIRTSGLYYSALIEEMELDTETDEIAIKVSHLVTEEGTDSPQEPLFITEVVGGDTITEVVGGDTIKEVVN